MNFSILVFQDVETQKSRSNLVMSQVRHFAESNSITLGQAVGYMLHRHFWNRDRGLAKLGAELFSGNTPSSVSDVPALTCLWLASRNNLSRVRYTNLRIQLLKHVKLQPYSYLSELRLSLCPALFPWPASCEDSQQRGTYANLGEAVLIVVKRMIQYGGTEWLPCCSKGGGQKCSNVVASILISGD